MHHKSIFPLLSALVLAGCGEPECQNEIREELISPDGVHKVVIFSRDCGATTQFNCQASILPAGDPLPDDAGNAFIFDARSADVSWLDSKTLSVSVDGSARVFKRDETVRGIKLVYSHPAANEEKAFKPTTDGEQGGASGTPESH